MSTSAEEKPSGDGEAPPKKKGMLGWIAVGAVAGAAGVAAPVVLLSDHHATDKKDAAPVHYEMLPSDQAMFIPFGSVTVNLNESRMNRYLRVTMSLQIDKSQEHLIQEKLRKQEQSLKNWLLSHISDKQLEEIRGAAGQNMLRREIRDQFNTALFADGFDRIYDVLFEEFAVQ